MTISSSSGQNQETHPFAQWSILLGLIGCVMLGAISAIPAVIFGHVALMKLRSEPEKYTGKKLAIAGLILGYSGIIFSIFFVLLLFATFFCWDLGPINLGRRW